jgi:MFS family permease
MSGAVTASAFLIAQYCQLVLGYSPLGTGLHLLPWTATPLLIAPVAGRLSDRIGRRPVLATGLLLQAVGLGWFALLADGRPHYAVLVTPLVVAGIGISMALPTAATAAINAVRPEEMGKASGTNSTLQRLGAVFCVAIATTVFTAAGGTATTFAAGFRPALEIVAAMSLLGVGTASALRGRHASRSASAPAARLVDAGSPTA